MNRKLAVVIPFHSGHANVQKVTDYDEQWRLKTTARPEWWAQRADIFKRYTLASLLNQSFKDFDIWLVLPCTEEVAEVAEPLLAVVRGIPQVRVTFDQDEVRHYYADKCDELLWVHLDSDDMYGPDAMSMLNKARCKLGMVLLFDHGYIYNCMEKILAHFDSRRASMPFYTIYYTKIALASVENWNAYRLKYKLERYHWQMSSCQVRLHMPEGQFCFLVHGGNVVSTWENPNIQSRVRSLVDDETRLRILRTFLGEKHVEA